MTLNRPRGLSLAILLLAMLALSAVLGALLARTSSGRQVARHEADRAQERYEAASAMNQVLAHVRAGQDPASAARDVSRSTGVEVLAAGDHILVAADSSPLQARLEPRAWQHVLFADTLNLNGLRGSFPPDDPHLPAQGTPPAPTARFLETIRARARASGILLAADPAACSFQPGGGAWQETVRDGLACSVYMGGGAGDALGWRAGDFRWSRMADRWIATSGEEFRLSNGVWTLRVPPQGSARLAGTLLVEGASLQIAGDLDLQGQLVIWEGFLAVPQGKVSVAAAPDTLAVAALAGTRTASRSPWSREPAPRPGDVLFHTGWSRLVVGDLSRPEETGALVLAQGRLLKRGARLLVAGVVAAGCADLDGVPAGEMVWSGRVGRLAPPELTARDVGVTDPTHLDVR